MKNPTDLELDAAFAEHVVKCGRGHPQYEGASYCTSIGAVLPWLEDAGRWNVFRDKSGMYEIELEDKPMPDEGNWFAFDKSLPRAAVIALLRAHGIEIEFT